MPRTHDLASAGTHERDIRVSISYRIIELFSAGLYSSPHKAIEELVANSYDAGARNTSVLLPINLDDNDAVIWVIDDGEGMDLAGFERLWRIASSTKRASESESTTRPPIGKFGIGKLATYVLASQLTYLSKQNGQFRALTMDFSRIDPAEEASTDLRLSARSLSEQQAASLLADVERRGDEASVAVPLFGPNAPPSWTVAAMANLKTLARRLQTGRLRWVLATALPLSPQFTLFLNGERLKPSKERTAPLNSWTIGKDDEAAVKLRLSTVDATPAVIVPGVGQVTGIAEVYEDSLTGGKSENWGRSHGIFVMVRGRLVNIDDVTFGISKLPLGPLSRFRLELHADGLDEVLRATRESVLETDGVVALREYVLAKFNEVRGWYATWLAAKEYEQKITTRVGSTPRSLSRKPLYQAIRAALEERRPLKLTRVPTGLDAAATASLLRDLEADVDSAEGLIREVVFEALGMDSPLAVYKVESRRVCVNLLHPFYANYADHYHNPEPFELLAVTEVLTEAYLLEAGLALDQVAEIMDRRDRFLRELVYSRQLAAPLVAQLLRDSGASAAGLEVAVGEGLRSLGFEVSPIGGNGKPDGTALARLGVRDWDSGDRADYLVTYDAKSTGGERIKAHTVGISAIDRHRRDYSAHFALVVAPGFQGDGDAASALTQEAKQNGYVTLVTVEDFVQLVFAGATRQLGLTKLRGLFESCRAPHEARAWIRDVLMAPANEGPIKDILEAIWALQKDSPDPIKFAAVRMQTESLKRYRERELVEWMASVRRLAGGLVTIAGDVVSLEAPPDRILRELRAATSQVRLLLRDGVQSEGN
jgi:hypothetical protein